MALFVVAAVAVDIDIDAFVAVLVAVAVNIAFFARETICFRYFLVLMQSQSFWMLLI